MATSPSNIVVITGESDVGPSTGSRVLLESDTEGTDFLLLEDPAEAYLLLEE